MVVLVMTMVLTRGGGGDISARPVPSRVVSFDLIYGPPSFSTCRGRSTRYRQDLRSHPASFPRISERNERILLSSDGGFIRAARISSRLPLITNYAHVNGKCRTLHDVLRKCFDADVDTRASPLTVRPAKPRKWEHYTPAAFCCENIFF